MLHHASILRQQCRLRESFCENVHLFENHPAYQIFSVPSHWPSFKENGFPLTDDERKELLDGVGDELGKFSYANGKNQYVFDWDGKAVKTTADQKDIIKKLVNVKRLLECANAAWDQPKVNSPNSNKGFVQPFWFGLAEAVKLSKNPQKKNALGWVLCTAHFLYLAARDGDDAQTRQALWSRVRSGANVYIPDPFFLAVGQDDPHYLGVCSVSGSKWRTL